MRTSEDTVFDATVNNWKKYYGIGVSEFRKVRQLKEVNAKLKQIAADLSVDRQMLKDVIKETH